MTVSWSYRLQGQQLLEDPFSKRAEPTITALASEPQGLIASFKTGGNQVIYDGAFRKPYTRTTRAAISGGYRYTVRNDNPWQSAVAFDALTLNTAAITNRAPALGSPLPGNQAIAFDVVDESARVALVRVNPDETREVVFDGYEFTFFYKGVSTYDVDFDDPDYTHSFLVRRIGGWFGHAEFVAYARG